MTDSDRPQIFLTDDEKRMLKFLKECEDAGRVPNVFDIDPPMSREAAERAIRTLLTLGLVESIGPRDPGD